MSAISLQGNAGGTGTLTIAAPSTNTNRTLTLPDGTGTFSVAGVNSNIVSGTAVASTSGTSIDFTSIPSWVKRITIMFNGVGSTTGASQHQLQLGSGSIDATSYVAQATQVTTSTVTGVASTTGFPVIGAAPGASLYSGFVTLVLISGTTWLEGGVVYMSNATTQQSAGKKTLSGVLDRIRLTSISGTETFNAGSINILYE